MSEATQPVPTAQPHRNHGLFSDHYLDVTLPERPQWKELVEQARPVMEEISRGLLHTQRGPESRPTAGAHFLCGTGFSASTTRKPASYSGLRED